MENKPEINAFLKDIRCLEPLTSFVTKINIFDVLRISRTEIRHSNMLAWLLDPNANHGLGDQVLRGVLQCVTKDIPQEFLPQDLFTFTIHREWNNIDLLAVSEAEKYILCIENKTFSGEHDDQLERYRQLVEDTYPKYRKVFIYLTPRGKEPSDPAHWKAMDYAAVLQVIRKAQVSQALPPEADLLIRNYMDVIKRLGGDEEIRQQCAAIWEKHRSALDILYSQTQEENEDDPIKTKEQRTPEKIRREYRKELDLLRRYKPGRGPDRIAEIIHAWAEQKAEEGRIRYFPDNSSDATTRFTTQIMSRILPDVPGAKSAWKTENFYFYEIRNQDIGKGLHELYLQFCVGSQGMPKPLRKTCDVINEFYPAPQKKEDWAYRLNLSTAHVLFLEDADEDDITSQLDLFLEDVRPFEVNLMSIMGI
jgi:hypothetical protein